jgi:hypothetical protein
VIVLQKPKSHHAAIRGLARGAYLAARFRGLHRLKTPDGLHAATAAPCHATGLIANDPVFERVDAFETLVLERLL